MEERRTGKVREKILETLNNVVDRRDGLDARDYNLATAFHKKIGGPNFVLFSNMFREVHSLLILGELSGDLLDLAMEIYTDADDLDRKEYLDRRRIN
jgi:hypothetical protein